MTRIVLHKLLKNVKKDKKLEVEQSVYVPSTTDRTKELSTELYNRRVKSVELFLSKLFGGETSSKVNGGYVLDNKIVSEKITKVTSFASIQAYNKHKNKLMNRLQVWKKTWGQETIGFEIEGDLYYV